MIQPTVEVTRPSAYLIDGMALVQKLKVDYLTFGEIADNILSRVLREAEGSDRVDVVFDVYGDISNKSAERELRGESDAITFKNLAAGQKVKQFKIFLRNGDNKSYQICCGTLAKNTGSQETGRQGAVCNMWKPMLQDHCRESRGRRRAKIRTRGG